MQIKPIARKHSEFGEVHMNSSIYRKWTLSLTRRIFYCYLSPSPSFIKILLTYNMCTFKVYNMMIRHTLYCKMIATVRLVNTFIS